MLRASAVSIVLSLVYALIYLGAYLQGSEIPVNHQLKYILGCLLAGALLTLSWSISFKRQGRYPRTKRRALPYAQLLVLFLLILLEFLAFGTQGSRAFQWIWLLSGICGGFIGVWSFRLLYRRCL